MHRLNRLLLLTALALGLTSVQAIEVAGVATIVNGNIPQAREHAVQDALHRAALTAGVTIRGSSKLVNGRLTEQARIKSGAVLGAPKIMGERMELGQLHVAIEVAVDRTNSCGGSSPYYKRVAFTAFPMAMAGERRLSNRVDWEMQLPQQVMSNLRNTGKYDTLNQTGVALFSSLEQAPRMVSTSGLPDLNPAQIAAQMGAQFLVAGVVRSYQPSNWRDFERMSFDLYLFDGRSGSLLHQSTYSNQDPARNPDWRPPQDDQRESIPTLFKRASADIDQVLKCLPLTAQVTRVEGNEVYVNSGTSSQVRAGDQFNLYQVTQTEVGNTQVNRERANGQVTITQAFPNFSIGRLDENQLATTRDLIRDR